MTDSGITMKDAIKSICERFDLPFDDIIQVDLDHKTDPSLITIWFKDNPEPLVIKVDRKPGAN